GHLEVARLLLHAEADKDKARHSGATPLYSAAGNGHLEVARLLLEAKADKHKVTGFGVSPLFIAAQNGNLKVARLLHDTACTDSCTAVCTGSWKLLTSCWR
ncbi:CTTNBP2, partial [Symbiodinium necroappetens]